MAGGPNPGPCLATGDRRLAASLERANRRPGSRGIATVLTHDRDAPNPRQRRRFRWWRGRTMRLLRCARSRALCVMRQARVRRLLRFDRGRRQTLRNLSRLRQDRRSLAPLGLALGLVLVSHPAPRPARSRPPVVLAPRRTALSRPRRFTKPARKTAAQTPHQEFSVRGWGPARPRDKPRPARPGNCENARRRLVDLVVNRWECSLLLP